MNRQTATVKNPQRRIKKEDSLGIPFAQPQGGRRIMARDVMRQRCLAKHNIRGHQGLIYADTRGTIEGEIDNLGRHLIAVRWDTGLQMYVFPDEIEIDNQPKDRDQHRCDKLPRPSN
jgi:hypothetical protein